MRLSSFPISPSRVELDSSARKNTVAIDSGDDQEDINEAGPKPEGAAVGEDAHEDDGPQDEDEAGEPVRCLPCPGTPTAAE